MPVPAINDTLPDNMKNIRAADVRDASGRGEASAGRRPESLHASALGYEARYCCTSIIRGGFFEGDRLSGKVLDGGSDWQTVRHDGSVRLNARLTLRTSDNAGYVTASDVVRGRFSNRWLALAMPVPGLIATIPYTHRAAASWSTRCLHHSLGQGVKRRRVTAVTISLPRDAARRHDDGACTAGKLPTTQH